MNRLTRAALGFNIISLRHLFRSGPREVMRASGRAFAAAREIPPKSAYSIPEINLGQILGDRRPVIRLSVVHYEDGMLPTDQAMALLSILVAERPSVVLEIGTFMGHTTRQMAESLESARIHTVDLPPAFTPESDVEASIPKDDFHLIERRVVGREFAKAACSDRIQQHFGDTARWSFTEAGNPTFFFIDGSHTYEYCKNDSEKCFQICNGRGVFLWHDCDIVHPGVERLISEWRAVGRDVRRIRDTPLAYWKTPGM